MLLPTPPCPLFEVQTRGLPHPLNLHPDAGLPVPKQVGIRACQPCKTLLLTLRLRSIPPKPCLRVKISKMSSHQTYHILIQTMVSDVLIKYFKYHVSLIKLYFGCFSYST